MAKNTIKVKSYLNIQDEKVAAGAITPGMLVERTSADKVQAHSTAGGPAQRLFALEDENQGRDIDDAYAATGSYTLVKLWLPVPGEIVYAIVDDLSTAEDIAIGNFVESAGDGRVRKYTAQASGGAAEATNAIIGVAVSAQTTPGGRVAIEII